MNIKMRDVDPKKWMSKRNFFLRKSQAEARKERGYEPFNPSVSLAEILRKRKASLQESEQKFRSPLSKEPRFREVHYEPSQRSLRASMSNQSQMLIRESLPGPLQQSPKFYQKSAQIYMKRDRYSDS